MLSAAAELRKPSAQDCYSLLTAGCWLLFSVSTPCFGKGKVVEARRRGRDHTPAVSDELGENRKRYWQVKRDLWKFTVYGETSRKWFRVLSFCKADFWNWVSLPIILFSLNLPLKLTCYSEVMALFMLSPGLKEAVSNKLRIWSTKSTLPSCIWTHGVPVQLTKELCHPREKGEKPVFQTTLRLPHCFPPFLNWDLHPICVQSGGVKEVALISLPDDRLEW